MAMTVDGADGHRARDAIELGWWDSVKHIGERQALYANLEGGAAAIREYEQTKPCPA